MSGTHSLSTPKRRIRKDVDHSAPTASEKIYVRYVPRIQKRDGRIMQFDFSKITRAISRAMRATGEGSDAEAAIVAHKVASEMMRIAKLYKNFLPTVEGCQDEVERQLMLSDYVATSKAYILYRAERAERRAMEGAVPEKVRDLAAKSAQYFKGNPLGEFVYLRSYARWIDTEERRETWIETVDRYVDFMRENLGSKLTSREYKEVREAILKQEVMPSMRAMQFSGAPARRCHSCLYNCTYTAPTKLEDFAEIMYLSMQGCGVGFAVESENIEQLPQIQKQTGVTISTHVVADSKEGWCDALTLGLKSWYEGKDVSFDFSLIRPAGSRLATMGGKASGPDPLRSLLEFARERILKRQGRRLRAIDAHDIICKIGECVVAGGVRRTAMISLSDLDDADVRDAKKGQFYLTDPHRSVANNSAVYTSRPSNTELSDEWVALMKSGSGERGIFNRGSLTRTMPARRIAHLESVHSGTRQGYIGQIGTNPCGEILLQPKQFCNLSEVVARADDTEKSLVRKVKLAALIGTYQSTLTKFRYISKEWTTNCESERLLGVSITGQWDSPAVRNAHTLATMRSAAVRENARYARRFDVAQSTAVTAVKPSGTVSQMLDCSSGLHPRHAEYYIRRIRISATDSLFKMLRDQGVPHHPEVGQNADSATTFVLEFPVHAPRNSVCKNDISAEKLLEYWKEVKLNYTEHNPSATISVGEDEWIGVLAWVERNWDIIGGLSFLPREHHVYRLAPYEAIDKATYERLVAAFPKIDYAKLVTYERTDGTEQAREMACAGGTCEVEAMPESARI